MCTRSSLQIYARAVYVRVHTVCVQKPRPACIAHIACIARILHTTLHTVYTARFPPGYRIEKKFNVHTTQSSGNIRREARSQSTLTVVTTRLVELRQLGSKYSTSIPTTKFEQREETMADVPAKGACKIGEYTSAFLLSVGGTSRPAVVFPSTRVSSAPIHVLSYSSSLSPLLLSVSLSPLLLSVSLSPTNS